jgi:hypothetical protein
MNARVASLLLILGGCVPWGSDVAMAISLGKLWKLCDSLSELHSSLRERRLVCTVLRPALLPVRTAQFTQISRQVWRHTSLSLTESVWDPLRCDDRLYRQKICMKAIRWSSVHTVTPHSFNIHFNAILPSTTRYPKRCFPLRFSDYNFESFFVSLMRATSPTDLILFDLSPQQHLVSSRYTLWSSLFSSIQLLVTSSLCGPSRRLSTML